MPTLANLSDWQPLIPSPTNGTGNRLFWCSNYDGCLALAAKQNWPCFSCDGCRAFSQINFDPAAIQNDNDFCRAFLTVVCNESLKVEHMPVLVAHFRRERERQQEEPEFGDDGIIPATQRKWILGHKFAVSDMGPGTATVTRALSDRLNDGAADGDRVSEEALKKRVQRHEGIIGTKRPNNSPAPNFRPRDPKNQDRPEAPCRATNAMQFAAMAIAYFFP